MAAPKELSTPIALKDLQQTIAGLSKQLDTLRGELALRDKQLLDANDRVVAEVQAIVKPVLDYCLEGQTFSSQSLELLRNVLDSQSKLPGLTANAVALAVGAQLGGPKA